MGWSVCGREGWRPLFVPRALPVLVHSLCFISVRHTVFCTTLNCSLDPVLQVLLNEPGLRADRPLDCADGPLHHARRRR
jgi:hypothetical protein